MGQYSLEYIKFLSRTYFNYLPLFQTSFTLMPNLFVPGQPTVFKQLPRHIWVTAVERLCARLLSAPLEMCKHWFGSLYAEPVSLRDCETWSDSSGRDQLRRRGREKGTLCIGKRSHPGLKHCKILLGFVGDTVTWTFTMKKQKKKKNIEKGCFEKPLKESSFLSF